MKIEVGGKMKRKRHMIGWQTRKFAQCYPHNPMLINKFPPIKKKQTVSLFFAIALKPF